MTFWNEYFEEVSQNLAGRSGSFKQIFKYLDSLKCKEVFIVETGCYREEDNYSGDGCSTLLFDNSCQERPITKHSSGLSTKAIDSSHLTKTLLNP